MWLLIKQTLIAGSACCSSGVYFPNIVSRNDHAQMGTSFSASTIIGASSSKGDVSFLNDDEADRSFTHSLFGGVRFNDQWQAGASLAWFGRERDFYETSESSLGLGDTHLHLTFEPIADIAITTSLLIPTAKTTYESSENLQTDSFGRGLWTPSITALYSQKWSPWDFHTHASFRYAIGRSFDRPLLGPIEVEDRWGSSALIGGGYQWSFLEMRTGLGVGVHWDQGLVEVDRFQKRSTAAKLVWDAIAEISLPLAEDMRMMLSYKDQTLLGPTQSSDLARSLSLSLTKAWHQ